LLFSSTHFLIAARLVEDDDDVVAERLDVHIVSPSAVLNTVNVKAEINSSVLQQSQHEASGELPQPVLLVVAQVLLMIVTGYIAYQIGRASVPPREKTVKKGSTPEPQGPTTFKDILKKELSCLNEQSGFRKARDMLKQFGVEALRQELVQGGFVDANAGILHSGEDSHNVFAKIAAGTMVQARMEKEQEALGKYAERFMICCNRRTDDQQWNMTGADYMPRSSMARRHRFITTKNLHWQWFNPLVFGMVDPKDGGVDITQAYKELTDLKAAALHYCKHCVEPVWGDDIGLFVHIYGHSGVNSLFIHILDMTELGPSFGYHFNKNCHIDHVIAVLKKEHDLYQVQQRKESRRSQGPATVDEQSEEPEPGSSLKKKTVYRKSVVPPPGAGSDLRADESDGEGSSFYTESDTESDKGPKIGENPLNAADILDDGDDDQTSGKK